MLIECAVNCDSGAVLKLAQNVKCKVCNVNITRRGCAVRPCRDTPAAGVRLRACALRLCQA